MRIAVFVLLVFCAAACFFIWADCIVQRRRQSRAIRPAQVKEAMDVVGRINQYGITPEAPLTPEQMDELDKYAHMEELAECEEMREAGFRELELYAFWKNREAA